MPDETQIAKQPETDDNEIVSLKRIAAQLQRVAGDSPSRVLEPGTNYTGLDCFMVVASGDGATIESITVANGSGDYDGYPLGAGQPLSVRFTQIKISSSSTKCIAFDRE